MLKTIEFIQQHLQINFPKCTITGEYDFECRSQRFRIQRGGNTDHVLFRRDFLAYYHEDDLEGVLSRLDFYGLLSQAKGRAVLITKDGIKFGIEEALAPSSEVV